MIADLLPFSGADWQAMSSNTDIRLQGMAAAFSQIE
jgi:hypothetical protein